MFEPKALPIAKPGLPCMDARAEMTISGMELPKPEGVFPRYENGEKAEEGD